jgi:CRISPR/Cas system-associated endonuclease Cas1
MLEILGDIVNTFLSIWALAFGYSLLLNAIFTAIYLIYLSIKAYIEIFGKR